MSRAARPPAAASAAAAASADGDALGWESGSWAAGMQPWQQQQQHTDVSSSTTSALSGETWLQRLESAEHARQALAVSALAEEAAALATKLNNMQQQTASTQIDTLHRGDQVSERTK